ATVSVVIPSGLTVGWYYLLAKADANDVLFESQETNNTRAGLLFVGPDLIVSSLTVPTFAAPGMVMTVTDTVKNQGGAPAAASTVRFYWSTNYYLDASDVLMGSRDVPALNQDAISSS